MKRLVPLLLCAAILSACGGSDDTGRETTAGAGAPTPGAFSLEVTGDATEGARLPIRVVGDARGVELVLWRCLRPIEVLEWFPDPDEAAVGGWIRPPTDGGRDFERVWRFTLRERGSPKLPRVLPGLYLVSARRGPDLVCRTVLVPGLIVVAKRSPSEVLLFVADAGSGAPVRSAEVHLSGRWDSSRRRTDGSGVFRAAWDSPLPTTVIAANGDKASRPVLLLPPANGDEGDTGTVITTDRPVYLPGETVGFRAVELSPAGGRIRLWPIEERVFTCFDEEGRRLAGGSLKGEVGGTLWGSFPLPPETAPGLVRIEAGWNGASATIPVARAGTPPVRLGIRWEAPIPRIGQLVQVFIRAEDRFGRSLEGDLVEYTIERVSTRDGPHEPVTLAAGNAMLSDVNDFRTGFEAAREGRYLIKARVETADGEVAVARESVEVAEGLFSLEVEPDRLNCVPGEFVEVLVRKVPTPVYRMTITGEVGVGPEKTPFRMHVTEEETRVKVRIPAPGRNVIRAEAADSLGRGAEGTAEVWAVPDETANWFAPRLLILPDRRRYAPGDKARVMLLLPPDLEGAQVLFSVENGIHAVEQVLGRVLWIDAEVPARPGGSVSFRVAAVRGGVVYEAEAKAVVDRSADQLDVVIRLDPAEPLPGEEVMVQVEARTATGEPAAGFASLSVYDADLDAAAAADDPAMLPPRNDRLALWEPYLSVGQDGFSAVQPVPLPTRAGRWSVRAVVVSPDGRRGEAGTVVRAERPVSVEPVPPPFLVEGDEARIPVVLRCRGAETIRGELSVTAEDRSLEGAFRIPYTAAGAAESIDAALLRAGTPGTGRVTAEFTGAEGARAQAEVTVLPRTEPLTTYHGGILGKGRSRATLRLPGRGEATLRVTLDLGLLPAVNRAVGALAGMPDSTADGIAHRFAVGAALGKLDDEFLLGGSSALDRAAELAQPGLARLRALQTAEGAWPWCGGDISDPRATLAVVRALEAMPESPESRALLDSATAFLDRHGSRLDPPSDGERQERGNLVWWGGEDERRIGQDRIEATAAALRHLLTRDEEDTRAMIDGAARFLLANRRGAAWKSSRDTAAACIALLALAEDRANAGEATPEALVRIRRGRAILGNARLSADDLVRGSATFTTTVRPDRRGRVALFFESSAEDAVSWTATLEGAGGRPESREPGLSIAFYADPWGVVKLGDQIEVNLEIRSDSEERYLVVDSPFPAGTEPLRKSSLTIPDPPPGTRVLYLSDRVRFLVPRIAGGETNLGYALRAVRRGKFHDRPATVSLAYFPRVRAETSVEPPLSVE